MVTLKLKQIRVLPGQSVCLEDVDWHEFEQILEELGDRRNTRIAYNNKILTIVAPLLKHEREKVSLGDMVKALLDEMEIEHDVAGSTTLKRQDMSKGVEPDDSFYIQNFPLVVGKDRLDLNNDPPPDLAIEIDLTSKTQLEVYEVLGVLELWRYDSGHLRMDVLEDGKYVQVEESPTFPGWPIEEMVRRYVPRVREVGRSKAIREFRHWVRERI